MNNTEDAVHVANKHPRPLRMTERIRRIHTKAFWVAIIAALLCLFVLLTIIFASLWAQQNKKLQNLPCLSPQCVKAAENVLSSMDESVSPCENFFAYACNNWINNNEIPSGQNAWSTISKVTANVAHFMKEILENTTTSNPSRGLQIAQAFYESCMNTSLIDRLGSAPLFRQLRRFFGGWALLPSDNAGSRLSTAVPLERGKFNFTQFYLESITSFGTSPLFGLSVTTHAKNTSLFLIDISGSTLGLNRECYLNETDPLHEKRVNAYKVFMRTYSAFLGVPRTNLHEMDAVYEFEKKIAVHTLSSVERDWNKNVELSTLEELKQDCPVLDWHLLVSKSFEPLNYTVEPNAIISLSDAPMLKERCKLFKDYLLTDAGIRTIHNSAVWLFLWKTVTKMPKSVFQLMEDYHEADSGLKTPVERWSACVGETRDLFSMAVDRIFISQKFKDQSKSDVLQMVTEIQQTFEDNFATVSWMDEEDKVKAVGKVHSMKASVGYPQYLYDPAEEERLFRHMGPIKRDAYLVNFLEATHTFHLMQLYALIDKDKYRWSLSASTVNAYYSESANNIFFPAGILQTPFYHPHNPRYMNFGGIGTVIGHEITHAFDELGSKRDAEGNLRQWWSRSTREAFDQHSKCMVDQYSNYTILGINLDGKTSLGENIADNGGIKATFAAFQRLEAKYGPSPSLPGVNLTPTQLFFVSFAQIWCSKRFPQSTVNNILYDPHTIEDYRVIGTLSNFEDFAQAFNCPSGSPMNPSKKCIVW